MPFNILVVVEKNSWMDFHLADSLVCMGHTVTRFYFGNCVNEFYGYKRRQEQIEKNHALLTTAKKLQDTSGLDLIFCYVYDDFLLPKYAEALSHLNVPMVNYNVDMPSHWFRQIRIAPYFDIMLCAERRNMEHLARYAKKVFYFPMAARSLQSNKVSISSEKKYAVTFLGTAFPCRRRIIAELVKSSIPLSIFGKCWDSVKSDDYIRNTSQVLFYALHYVWPRFKAEGLGDLWKSFLRYCSPHHKTEFFASTQSNIFKGELPAENMITLFQQSKINIGLTRYIDDDPNIFGHCQMKLRDFEVPMAGGFYLVEKSPGYEEMFVDGEEVVMWRTLPELIEKIHFYLKHDDERETIASRGQKRAMRDHTWTQRFQSLFTELALHE